MIILAIGSNLSSKLGNRFDHIDLALSYLKDCNIKIIKKSSFYETPSYPNINNPKFINIVVEVFTDLTPADLAKSLLDIEIKLGRKRHKKNDPRTCDIDIIDFNGQILNFNIGNSNFMIPHEKIARRNFVLYPLKEIVNEWIHPKNQVTIDLLIEKLSDKDKNSILKVKKS
tara:strand:+ start:6693 stop:7205 length:513 start_codon:yes stop_codon:yes gene_type:complete